jgi:hypothetical protein
MLVHTTNTLEKQFAVHVIHVAQNVLVMAFMKAFALNVHDTEKVNSAKMNAVTINSQMKQRELARIATMNATNAVEVDQTIASNVITLRSSTTESCLKIIKTRLNSTVP